MPITDAINPTNAPREAIVTARHRALNGHTAGANGITACSLHYGNVRTPLVQVVPDDRWPGMWRLLWPDGELSDMGNLSWIRDAAAAIAERGPPARNRRRFHWKIDRSNRPAEGPPVRFGKKNDLPPISANKNGGARP